MFMCFISVLASSVSDSQAARQSCLHFLTQQIQHSAATADSVTPVTSSSSVSAGDKMISIDTTDEREVIITDDSFTIQPFSIPTGR